ncbi:5-formyltetrahydrofolate cyclo-ligase [Lentilactobacillus otakiensis]|uniref:5-formyltetrahydrofolate cyclo-ligase n=1 Tax=Lentilactobacillus otakiensis DSM 19908 = JCM 15040 TaxID=1423780 RepID=S4NET9_9LACO|nr:5-formyltetrahydrofolate cyclo-ligase [Lentilactobacillus otakiensis]KRL09278.1 5-formyltetrahydrofolate cyclo-ligase [Lentilactobacillus otakiensis DSM 19908 = JCM 15040]MBZ3776667.1 5-formyltetrahydrofolate cyclo-ligase [Lentilactobacillus otakiensis]MDV3519113.1 5-formyltetrahydrofolate cyclo-ligase [Lentilactobacillus otakiensis]GAD15717.1 5-formyltetrahydrofolate cyclo-ligase [Lentilactobacillus otakiensis DSM 19908 = JCM 15040]
MAKSINSKSVIRDQQIARLHDYLQNPKNQSQINHLYEELFTDSAFSNGSTFGITLSMDDELNTQPIIHWALSHGKKVAVPRTLPHRQMEFVLLEPDTVLSQTKFGTIEPVGGKVLSKNQLDTLLVPGLAFSKTHYRIGYGGGFYDRFLKGFAGTSIAVATPVQLFAEPVWDVEDFDVKINQLVYEK